MWPAAWKKTKIQREGFGAESLCSAEREELETGLSCVGSGDG